MPSKSLQALTTGLIDYAGLFPPASLSLAPAIQNYAHYIQSHDRWMLARFIIPANRLADLSDELMALFSAEYPLYLSLICPNLPDDLALIQSFATKYKDKIRLDIIETRLPVAGDLAQHVANTAVSIQASGLPLRPFYELPFNKTWDDKLETAVSVLATHNQQAETAVGFKLRCGGVEAHMFPSPSQVTRAILLCRGYGVAMKATAGLHHPVRHFDESVNTKMHGFLNVFGGGLLANHLQLDHATLQKIIEDENPASFQFNDQTFAWKDLSIDLSHIETYRQSGLTSYGSCSFDEPREDLQSLGLL